MMTAMTMELSQLTFQVKLARNELKNIRSQVHCLKKVHEHDVKQIMDKLTSATPVALNAEQKYDIPLVNSTDTCAGCLPYSFKPVGFVSSMFQQKNGTPRQASVCQTSRATLTISRSVFSNPEHSLDGLQAFSHIWLIFVFNKNNGSFYGAKVRPPRLNGEKVGLFATRCPHRPNPIGLTLAEIDRIVGDTVHLRGVDLLDGTPVLDIKPYIPAYDSPLNFNLSAANESIDNSLILPENIATDRCEIRECSENVEVDESSATCSSLNAGTGTVNAADVTVTTTISQSNQDFENTVCFNSDHENDVKTCEQSSPLQKRQKEILDPGCSAAKSPSSEVSCRAVCPAWVESPPIPALSVTFTPRAEEQLKLFRRDVEDSSCRLHHLGSVEELRSAITSILTADPRSVYRRKHCTDRLYYVSVDSAHVTCWFDGDVVEVLKIQIKP